MSAAFFCLMIVFFLSADVVNAQIVDSRLIDPDSRKEFLDSISPLIHAAADGDLEAIKSLVTDGANINIGDLDGDTPLMWATRHGEVESMRLLLDLGADIEATNKLGETAVFQLEFQPFETKSLPILVERNANLSHRDDDGNTVLIRWCGGLKLPETLAVALDAGVDVNAANNDGKTALMVCARLDRFPHVGLLLERGAEVDAFDILGVTALGWAAFKNNVEVMDVLIVHGASIDPVTPTGATPLMMAAGAGREAALELLLAHGANRDARNIDGQTAMDIARIRQKQSALEILRLPSPTLKELSLRKQLEQIRRMASQLESQLDRSRENDATSRARIKDLESGLDGAIARLAAERKRRVVLEQEVADLQSLNRYVAEFLVRIRDLLGNRYDFEIGTDRLVFISDEIFANSMAALSPTGRKQVARAAELLTEMTNGIPEEFDWMIVIEGHTDVAPISPGTHFADNWELSQTRALTVLRYLTNELGFPPHRLAPMGLGEFHPVNDKSDTETKAHNHRVELRIVER